MYQLNAPQSQSTRKEEITAFRAGLNVMLEKLGPISVLENGYLSQNITESIFFKPEQYGSGPPQGWFLHIATADSTPRLHNGFRTEAFYFETDDSGCHA